MLKRVGNDDHKINSTIQEDLKSQLLPSIKKCIQKFKHSKKCVKSYASSIINKFKQRKAGENNLGKLLKGIIVEELVDDARMRFFTSKVQEIASSIRDIILSDHKICNKISGEENTYQLSPDIIDKYKKVEGQQDKAEVKMAHLILLWAIVIVMQVYLQYCKVMHLVLILVKWILEDQV